MQEKTYWDDWITFNELDQTYDTRDGTRVAAEIVEMACCLGDILYISQLRYEQRQKRKQNEANS
jgi:hypothetical protein